MSERVTRLAETYDAADDIYKWNGEGVTHEGRECHRQFMAHARAWLHTLRPEDECGPFEGDHGSVGIDSLTAEELLIAMYG